VERIDDRPDVVRVEEERDATERHPASELH
jgi:hypothetical protein